jgi:cell division protein FtsB
MKLWMMIMRVLQGLFVALLAALVILLFEPKLREYQDLRRLEAQRRAEVREQEERHKALRMKQERFVNDPRFVETLAHDLGLARSNEVLFRIQTEPEAPAPPPPPRP